MIPSFLLVVSLNHTKKELKAEDLSTTIRWPSAARLLSKCDHAWPSCTEATRNPQWHAHMGMALAREPLGCKRSTWGCGQHSVGKLVLGESRRVRHPKQPQPHTTPVSTLASTVPLTHRHDVFLTRASADHPAFGRLLLADFGHRERYVLVHPAVAAVSSTKETYVGTERNRNRWGRNTSQDNARRYERRRRRRFRQGSAGAHWSGMVMVTVAVPCFKQLNLRSSCCCPLVPSP